MINAQGADSGMDDDFDKFEHEIFEKLKLLSFEERAFRIIKNFYLLQIDMEWDETEDDNIELFKKFEEWFYIPHNTEEKRRALQKVEEIFGGPASDFFKKLYPIRRIEL